MTADTADSHESPIVDVVGLTKTYGRRTADANPAVDDVSFSVGAGSVVGLLGPNGAGKTTTIKSLLGLIVPTAGTIHIDGVDVHDQPRAAYRRVSAVLEGARNIYWRLTVQENLEFFASLQGRNPRAIREELTGYLSTLGLAEEATTPVRALSRGMKQKAALACALARGTPLLFLDEPTLGLDVETSRDLRGELRRLVEDDGRTVILSSHDMDVVEAVCDRVIIMNDGRIVADDTVEALIDLFRTQVYRFVVDRPVPEAVEQRLRTRFQIEEWSGSGEQLVFEVVLDHGDDLYPLMSILEDAAITPRSIQAQEPDLEEAFLAVTDEQPSVVAPPVGGQR
ncbi:MAG: ABC transporter ATP-binding protein [Halobacteriales archaeon]